ncbi:MAG: site-specific DNA-methyltransferase [Anaerolineae bacterium]|nr:site-specific DNA-methyltransferase [Anaerolineae bacterium]
MGYLILNVDCFEWLAQREVNSVHAVLTDPPFGVKEYESLQQQKMRDGRGGVWRIPPEIGGSKRMPLPRFTVLGDDDIEALQDFFGRWAALVFRVLVPGAHLFVAANPLLSHVVFSAIASAGLEKRGEIIRLVRTFRGGDRPKGAEKEFEDLCTMPRATYEPWGLFRKPLEGRVVDNLRKWKTGALRRPAVDVPFSDVIESTRTPRAERDIAPHPSLKPQRFLRQLVWAALPFGEGVVLDPFMGSGSAVAAAEALGVESIGLEIDPEYFQMAEQAIPRLAAVSADSSFSHEGRFGAQNIVQPRLFEG